MLIDEAPDTLRGEAKGNGESLGDFASDQEKRKKDFDINLYSGISFY